MLKHFDREELIWDSGLPANEKLFLLALNSFVSKQGECCPGLESLSRMTGLTERTSRTIRDKLKAKGVVATGRRHTKAGHRTSDRYDLDFALPKSVEPKERRGGFVYLVEAQGTGRYKIGITNNIERRLRTLQEQSPYPLKCVSSHPSDDIYGEESYWHQRFADYRVHGEWFELTAAAVDVFSLSLAEVAL